MYYFASLPGPQAVAAIAEAAAAAATAESPLKRNLKWKMHQGTGMPSLTLPTVTADEDFYSDPRLAMSPNLPGSAAGLMSPNLLHPAAAAAAAAYGLAACNAGAMLERLGPHILRSHVPTVQYKAIPHNDEIDLEAFRKKDPREWNMDDVIGWMISVAKRRGIPVEDMNMHRFATCTGPLLTLMSQQNFIERDPNFGGLLYLEFRKLMGDDGSSFLDEWIRCMHRDELEAGSDVGTSSATAAANALFSSLAAETMSSSLRLPSVASDQPCTSRQADDVFGRHSAFRPRESVIKAAGSSSNVAESPFSAAPPVHVMGSLPDLGKLKAGPVKGETGVTNCDGGRFGLKFGDSMTRSVGANGGSGSVSASTIPKFPDGKIKKKLNEGSCSLTISGKPRKRSQHTRGNKLWEFIRSALRDSRTCPSIVKWEDEREGVFRIVESEKLARLWGEKKNNQKMTYEKLSRAMRTYYEKQILVPVPKTGLYPKKLVYKFGPNAKGWQLTGTTTVLSAISKAPPRSSNDGKTTNQIKPGLPLATTVPNVPFPLRPPGMASFGAAGSRVNAVSSALLSKADSAAVDAANGLMSLADVASRQLAASRSETEEVIDVDGHSETGDCSSAIEETMVGEDDADEIIDDEDEDNEEDID